MQGERGRAIANSRKLAERNKPEEQEETEIEEVEAKETSLEEITVPSN